MADKVKILSVNVDIGQSRQRLGELTNAMGVLKNQKARLDKQMRQGKELTRAQQIEYSKLKEQIHKTKVETKKYDLAINRANGSMSRTSGFVMGIRKALTGMAAQFMGAMAAFALIKNVIGTFKDFEQANADLASVLGKTTDEIKDLSEEAKKYGATTKFTASEVSGLQKEFAKLGFSVKEIKNATKATLDLAAATNTDLARAAEVAGATVRGFGLDASETQRVTDVMAKSFSSSALDMEKFATSMRAVAPVAKNAGLNIEQTTSMLGILVDRGVDASTAGTSLRNVFLELSKQGLTFEEAMQQINESTDKNATALDLFGKRGAVTGTILAETGVQVSELEEKLNNAGGAAERMAETQLDTLSGKLTILNSAWEGFILSIEDGEGVIGGFLQGIVGIATDLLGLVTATGEAKESTQELFKENSKSIAKAKELQKEYNNLSEKTNLTAEESKRLTIITNDLSDMFGASVVNIDNETGALSLNTAELTKQIAIRQALQSEQVKELLADRLRFETQLSTIESNKVWLEQLKQSKDISLTVLNVLNDEASALGNVSVESAELAFTTSKLSEAEKILVERIRKAQVGIASESIAKQNLINVNQTLLDSGIDLEAIAQQEIESTKRKAKTTDEEVKAKEKAANDLAKLTEQMLNQIDQLEIDNNAKKREREAIQIKDEEEREKAVLESKRQKEEDQAIFDFENKINKIQGDSEIEAQLKKSLKEKLDSDLIEIGAKYDKIEIDAKEKQADKEREIAKKTAKIKEKLQQQNVNDAVNLIGTIGGLMEQGTQRQKAVLSAQTLISTYLSAQRAYQSQFIPGVPDPSAPVRATVAAALAVAQGLARVAAINNVKFAKGGVLRGKSHARGGIPTIDGQYEFEGGEAVINKRSTARYGALLSQINQAGGGVAFEKGGITKFQDGGISAPVMSLSDIGDNGANDITQEVTSQVSPIKVVNVVTDTMEAQNSILNVQSEAEIG